MSVTQAGHWGRQLGHDYKWPSSPPTSCSCAGYRSRTLEGRPLRVMTTNGLQSLLPSAAVPVTQARRWWGVSWGSRLQMAFKSSYHLQSCRLAKLDVEGRKLGVMIPNGLQVLLAPTAMSVTQVIRLRGIRWGHDSKIAFR